MVGTEKWNTREHSDWQAYSPKPFSPRLRIIILRTISMKKLQIDPRIQWLLIAQESRLGQRLDLELHYVIIF